MPVIITQGVEYQQLLDDLRALIRHEVSQHGPAAPAPSPDTADELLTIKQAAQLLDVCEQTIHDWKRRGLLPYHKLGGRVYLKKADVLAAPRSQQRSLKGRGRRG